MDVELGEIEVRNKEPSGGGKGPGWAVDEEGERGRAGGKSDKGGGKGRSKQPGVAAAHHQPKFMQKFFEDVDSIKQDIAVVRNATQSISSINEESVMATTSDKEKELSKKLTPLIMNTNKRAKRAKMMLAKVKEDNDKFKRDGKVSGRRCKMQAAAREKKRRAPPHPKAMHYYCHCFFFFTQIKASELRIRVNLCSTLTRKFVDEMRNYQKAQQQYKSDIKNKVKRQVQIVRPSATDEEIETVMKSEGGKDQLYKDKILKGVADPIKNAYANVADKYQDVLTLEASVAELHQMFLDFALLTEQQGEMLDQIEYQVKSASDYIDDGNTEITSAIKYQKMIRKKQCCIILIVLVILMVILLASGVFT